MWKRLIYIFHQEFSEIMQRERESPEPRHNDQNIESAEINNEGSEVTVSTQTTRQSQR